MTLTRVTLLLLSLASLAQGGCCCCFGSDWAQYTPPVREDEGAVEEARRYFQEHADALVAQVSPDAGPGGSEGCVSGLGALAFDVAAAVITRGHAGGDSAAQVSIDPGACFRRVVILVVLTAGAWHAVSVVAEGLAGGSASIGTDPGYFLQETVSPPGESSYDSDWGSDELF